MGAHSWAGLSESALARVRGILDSTGLGAVVLIFLAVFFVFAYALKREFWKDIH